METAVMTFCQMDMNELIKNYQLNPLIYTNEIQLPYRCFESIYILMLLEYGYGFNRHDRSITYALEVS